MRKRATTDLSSFDMLLDTMCNTFGGIVFIALLLSIVSGAVSRHVTKPESASLEDLVELEQDIELAKLEREYQELNAARKHLEESLTSQSVVSPADALAPISYASSNETLRVKLSELEQREKELELILAELTADINDPGVKAELEREIANLSEELEQARSDATRKLRLPKLRQKEGVRVFFAIKDGRFLAIHDVAGKTGLDREFDKNDVVVESGPDQDVVELRKGAGQVIKPGAERQGKLAAALANLDPKTENPFFIVSTNSFKEFNYVKTTFVDRGFSYNWSIDLHGGAIILVQTSEPLETQ
jgi:hypothetical protein